MRIGREKNGRPSEFIPKYTLPKTRYPSLKTKINKLCNLQLQLDNWMREIAWPLWWQADRHDNGSFYEALDFNGRPVASEIARVRVQARQIFSFAMARTLGWQEPTLPKLLRLSIDRFLDTCFGPEGIPGTLVDIEQGQMTDSLPNLYNTAFTITALVKSHQALGNTDLKARLDQLFDDIDRYLAYPGSAGYRETLPADGIRLQNPHMHLFESLLYMYEAYGGQATARRAGDLLGFIRCSFFDEEAGIVWERVTAEGQPIGDNYEPGHSLEWIWLLGWYARLLGEPLDPFAVRLYSHYHSAGIAEGKTPMGLSLDNGPADSTRRLWSQTESLKAHLTIYSQGPEELRKKSMQGALDCGRAIQDDWLDIPCAGGWYDHFDAEGVLIAKDIPGSMGYHLYVAIEELSRITRREMPG